MVPLQICTRDRKHSPVAMCRHTGTDESVTAKHIRSPVPPVYNKSLKDKSVGNSQFVFLEFSMFPSAPPRETKSTVSWVFIICVSLHFFRSDLVKNSAMSSSDSCARHLYYFTIALATSFPGKYKYHHQPRFHANVPSNRWDTSLILQYCKQQLVIKNTPGDWSQSETVNYFELIIMDDICTWFLRFLYRN